MTPFLVQKIIEHSQSKEKFLRASLRRITEAQNFEDELTWMSGMNEMLLARNKELEAQLEGKHQEKNGMQLISFFFYDHAQVCL
jgi:hypothetical protein